MEKSSVLQSAESSRDVCAVDPRCVMFEPDVMLPSQFHGEGEQGVIGGERRLMAAILSDGVEAYIASRVSSALQRSSAHRNDSSAKSSFKHPKHTDAQDWVDDCDDSYVFSFDNVCSSLGIDPDYLRLGLSRYVQAVRDRKQELHRVGDAWKRIRRPRK